MLNPDMVREATRLTRAGQLVEATALLQRMLRGDGGPAATRGTTVPVERARLEPPTLGSHIRGPRGARVVERLSFVRAVPPGGPNFSEGERTAAHHRMSGHD